jgi:hypothetical protein
MRFARPVGTKEGEGGPRDEVGAVDETRLVLRWATALRYALGKLDLPAAAHRPCGQPGPAAQRVDGAERSRGSSRFAVGQGQLGRAARLSLRDRPELPDHVDNRSARQSSSVWSSGTQRC